jgi:dGTPase
LAHDLGHPPFGHIAETELNSLLTANNISDGFEGNAQSFRVVTKFGMRLGKTPGLNLTRASLNAILKYPWGKDENNKTPNKWGYYQSEGDDFRFARQLEAEDKRRSAEAEVMDWADDVAYSVHDVEDFYRAGLIPLDQILAGTKERERFIDHCFERWSKDPDKPKFAGFNEEWASKFFDVLKFFTSKFDLTEPFCASLTQLAGLDFFTAFLIKRYVRGPDDATQVLTLIDRRKQPRIRVEPQLRAEVDLLKKLMSVYVFDNSSLVAQQFGQRRVIKDLFVILFEAAKPGSKERGIIPEPFREVLAGHGSTDDTGRARVVADLIGSMTEQQALLFHQRLLGINPGSVRDLIIR